MTLRDLIRLNPDRFYAQTWYRKEAFLDNTPKPWLGWPSNIDPFLPTPECLPEYTTADLAQLWLERPDDPIWERYLWTSDRDSTGQRVYVGQNGYGLEIHRHLHLSERWGCPV
jgi:hypothetical protein